MIREISVRIERLGQRAASGLMDKRDFSPRNTSRSSLGFLADLTGIQKCALTYIDLLKIYNYNKKYVIGDNNMKPKLILHFAVK